MKRFLAFGMIALLLGLLACDSDLASGAPDYAFFRDSLLTHPWLEGDSGNIRSELTQFYEGQLDTLPLHMRLDWVGDSIYGTLFVQGAQAPQLLAGHWTPEEVDTLRAFDMGKRPLGLIIGVFDKGKDVWGQQLEGRKSPQTIELQLVRQEMLRQAGTPLSPPLVIERQWIEKSSQGGSCNVRRIYLQFSGLPDPDIEARINARLVPESADQLQLLADSCEAEMGGIDMEGMEFIEEESQQFNSISGTVLSLNRNFYSYYGGAHGNYGSSTQNFDLQTGEPLAAEDFFLPGYETTLNREIREALKTLYPYDLVNLDFRAIDSTQNFEVYPDKLVAYFNPYEMGPYAMGQIRVPLPYERLRSILRPDGPLDLLLYSGKMQK